MEVFKDYAYYYNSFYNDKDYRHEAKQIDCLLKKYGKGIHKLINLGCGTGKHDIELSKMGYCCAGIDLSSSMIDIARENAKNMDVSIEFAVADVRNYNTKVKYDAAVSLFHVMSYQNTNQDILAAFKTARSLVEVGGIFVFDVWYGPGVLTDKPSVRVKKIEDVKNELVRIAKPVMYDKKNLVEVYYEILIIDKKTGKTKAINEIHKMRYYFKPEIEFFLNESGFVLIENLDCQTLEETDYNSWTSYFIAKAK